MSDDLPLFEHLTVEFETLDTGHAWRDDLTVAESVELLREVFTEAEFVGYGDALRLIRHRYSTGPNVDNRRVFACTALLGELLA